MRDGSRPTVKPFPTITTEVRLVRENRPLIRRRRAGRRDDPDRLSLRLRFHRELIRTSVADRIGVRSRRTDHLHPVAGLRIVVRPPRPGSRAQESGTARVADTVTTSGAHEAGGATSPSGSSDPGDGGSAEYAWHHPCSSKQITVTVTRRPTAPTQRLISVRNNGHRACGLSYYPSVVLYDADAANGGTSVVPMVPDGLGGPPAYPVYAGATAYAVVDLDPSGATEGTVPGVNAMNVLADADHMPNRETLRFPLGDDAHVLKPKLGLYETTVARAVTSMRSADIQP